MRAALGVGPEVSDAEVAELYAASIDVAPAQGSALQLVTLADAKRHLKLEADDDSEDAFIEGCIEAAIGNLDGPEGWLGRCLVPRALTYRLDALCGSVRLPYPPIIALESITYSGSAGAEQIVDVASYVLDDRTVRLAVGHSWPSSYWREGSVRINYRAGYNALPKAMKHAILMMVADMSRFRETVTTGVSVTKTPMSTAVETLLGPFRVFT
jgi:uncharacterized phiE125 gp8 family phage protein